MKVLSIMEYSMDLWETPLETGWDIDKKKKEIDNHFPNDLLTNFLRISQNVSPVCILSVYLGGGCGKQYQMLCWSSCKFYKIQVTFLL